MKKSLFLLSLVFLLGACSSDEKTIIEPENTDPVEIALSAKSLSIGVETKAPYTPTTPTSDSTLVARVISSKTQSSYATLYSDGTMSFASNANFVYNDGASNRYYPANDDVLYFSGLYPATGWTAAPTTEAAFTFNGSHDVMYAGQPDSKKTTATSSVPALTFNHLLTLLNVSVIAENDDAIAAWGDVTGISLTGNTVATVTLDGTGATTFGTSGTIPFYLTGTDNAISGTNKKTLTKTATVIAYSMVEAVTATNTANEYVLTITTGSGEETRSATVDLNLKDTATQPTDFTGTTKGKSFDVILTFKTTEIQATASVTAWAPSGSASGDVQ